MDERQNSPSEGSKNHRAALMEWRRRRGACESSEIRDNMPHESFADRVGGVVAGGDEDGVLRIAVHEDSQELVAVIRRKRSHNVN